MTIDYDRIRQKAKAIKEKREKEDIERGYCFMPIPGFVPESIACKLTNRCRPLVAFITEYTRLCDGANEVLDISDNQMKWIDSFATDIELLNYVEDVHAYRYQGVGRRLSWIIPIIKKRKKYINNIDSYISKIFIMLSGIEFRYSDPHDTDISEYDYQVLCGKLREVKDVEQQQQSITKALVTQ